MNISGNGPFKAEYDFGNQKIDLKYQNGKNDLGAKILFAMLNKNKDFEYENEWRFICTTMQDEAQSIRNQKINYNKESIKRIILGMNFFNGGILNQNNFEKHSIKILDCKNYCNISRLIKHALIAKIPLFHIQFNVIKHEFIPIEINYSYEEKSTIFIFNYLYP